MFGIIINIGEDYFGLIGIYVELDFLHQAAKSTISGTKTDCSGLVLFSFFIYFFISLTYGGECASAPIFRIDFYLNLSCKLPDYLNIHSSNKS